MHGFRRQQGGFTSYLRVCPQEESMIHIDLFSGIGGFALAAKWMGWHTPVFCEIMDFPRKVLQHHFPDSYIHGDIRTLNKNIIQKAINERIKSNWGGKIQSSQVAFRASLLVRSFWQNMAMCLLRKSIKAYGNAIVPQVAYEIFKFIERYGTEQDL